MIRWFLAERRWRRLERARAAFRLAQHEYWLTSSYGDDPRWERYARRRYQRTRDALERAERAVEVYQYRRNS